MAASRTVTSAWASRKQTSAIFSGLQRLAATPSWLFVLALLLIASVGATARPAGAQVAEALRDLEERIVPNELVIHFRADAGRKAYRALQTSFEVQLGDPRAKALDEALHRGRAVGLRRVFRGLEDAQGNLRMTARERASQQLERRLQRAGRRRQLARGLERVPDLENFFVLELAEPLSAEELLGLASALEQTEWVVTAQPNYLYELHAEPLPAEAYIPNDRYVTQDGLTWSQGAVSPDFPDLYGIRNVRAIEGWNLFDADDSGSLGLAQK